MRKQQLRNAMVLLFLSQETPLIMAGMSLAGPGKAITMLTARIMRFPGLIGGSGYQPGFIWICETVIALRRNTPVFHMAKGTGPSGL